MHATIHFKVYRYQGVVRVHLHGASIHPFPPSQHRSPRPITAQLQVKLLPIYAINYYSAPSSAGCWFVAESRADRALVVAAQHRTNQHQSVYTLPCTHSQMNERIHATRLCQTKSPMPVFGTSTFSSFSIESKRVAFIECAS